MKRLFGLLGALVASAVFADAEVVVDVCNGRFDRYDYVVRHDLIPLSAGTNCPRVLELKGGQRTPVPAVLDRSGERPQVVWTLPGHTPPRTVRSFVFESASVPPAPVPATDLACRIEEGKIHVGTRFFSLVHPLKGHGGMPQDVCFRNSGFADEQLELLDRAYDRETRCQPGIASDADATARVVFQSPLRVVVEARTRYCSGGKSAPDNLRAVYRYIYTANSPVVEVEAEVSHDAATAIDWDELHFLELSRREKYYETMVTGPKTEVHVLQPKGAKSRAYTGPRWGLLASTNEMAGVAGPWVGCWDASNEFVYYASLRRDAFPRTETTRQMSGLLYFGPALPNDTWLEGWLGTERRLRMFTDGEEADLGASSAAPGRGRPDHGEGACDFPTNAVTLETTHTKLVFADAAGGFDCLGLEEKDSRTRFIQTRAGSPGLWRLKFRAGPAGQELALDARAGATRAVATTEGIRFLWEKLSLSNEVGVVDVACDVTRNASDDSYAFRIQVANRSATYGLYETAYPILSSIQAPGAGDALVPGGNWGGRLIPSCREGLRCPYPSARCPMQFAAFLQRDVGLYFAAEDGAATTKAFNLTREQDVSFETLASDAGVPGKAGAPEFPVVLSCFRGDWWQAAARYRAWAARQLWTKPGPLATRADYPRALKVNGFWLQVHGTPAQVEKTVEKTLARVGGRVPFGVHWYCWHQIPFDHSYPEYFPAREGFGAVVRRMTAKGVLVMPYINARLWDRDIPSYAGARASATKDVRGEVPVETYGSGRYLAPMCPVTDCWRSRMADVCRRLMEEGGVNAIYLDQIGAAAPAPCFDATHGHSLGGGGHWTAGYRTMLRPIKAAAAAKGVTLTTENTAEPYMDTIDAYLTWSPDGVDDVPALPAVYSGYTTWFASPENPNDTLEAFRACQTRDTLWGCQIGWISDWILDERHREHFECLVKLASLRQAHRDYFTEGRLIGEVKSTVRNPPFCVTWRVRKSVRDVMLRSVMAVVWENRAGRRLLVATNLSSAPATFRGTPPGGAQNTFVLMPGEVRCVEYRP